MRKLKYQEENSKMAITNISLLGLGAEGAVAYYALRQTLPSNQIAVLASGERASRLKAVLIENIYLDIWRKYMLNAACNTVETIFKGTHRWFQNISEACDAMECIMEEIVSLANAMDVPLSEQDIRSLDGFFANYDPDGMCSMVQDMIYGNPTEIDMFMGEALRLGNRYHVKLPVCRFVYDIITSMEKARKFA